MTRTHRLNFVLLAALLPACGGGGGSDDDSGTGGAGGNGSSPIASSVCQPGASPQDLSSRPQTIPALREWAPTAGSFQFSAASRIVVHPPAATGLQQAAETFADDLAALTGRAVEVVATAARAGDIEIGTASQCDPRLGAEGYGMRVGETIQIAAPDVPGVFYGTRSVLQLLRQGNSIAAGQALDWPRYPERGLLVDFGRKYFTPAWFHQHVKELAYLKLNYLHMHFSENLGFRIESASHPEIVSAEHLTKAEVREIVALAQRYHITVVGEIGMPGHMGAALAPHPEFQLADTQGERAPDKLDVTNPAAVQFARELIEEFLPLFPSVYWHAGGDEYLPTYDYPSYPQLEAHAREQYGPSANGADAVLGFMNEINDFVRSRSRTNRVWHDGLSGGSAVTANPNMVVEWWTDFNPLGTLLPPAPQAFLDQGHAISNASYWPTYYTVGAAAGFPEGLPPRPDLCSFYEGWDVNVFVGPLNPPAVACNTVHLLPPKTVDPDEPRNLGSKVFIFTDTPDAETEEEIAEGVAPRLRIMAQKTWNSPPLAPRYAEFEAIMDTIGHAPGY